ncbi:MAG: phosphotransferase family protein [Ardenticatenales bacterium]|nr:phosphotransferase family protein [Ardenticatenales bacterium]
MQNNLPLDRAVSVRPGEALDTQSLESYLLAQLPGTHGPLVVEQFPSGYSNLTYLLRLGEQELVLRRPPFGAAVKSGHDMTREYRMLAGLRTVYPKVPQPLLYCEDDAVLGAPFYVMERINGVILRNRLPEGIGPEEMGAICHALVDTLVELHGLDYERAGLTELGHPEGYVARQVSGWTQRYHKARTDDLPELEAAAAWLAAYLPREQRPTLLHNDYRYDNVVLDPATLSHIIAILDWEMATLGDPLMDIGTTLGYWAEPGDPAELRQFGISSLPGNLDRQQVAERYAQQSGRDISDILFYYVYGLFKVAVIAQQIYYRYRQGHTQDPRFAGLIHIVRATGQLAARAIEKKRIHHLFE